jgi:hypothetical protein
MDYDPSSLIISIIALTVSIIVAIVAFRQMKISQKANTLAAVTSLLKEYRSPEFKDKISFIHGTLQKEFKPELGIWSLPELERKNVLSVCHLCDTLGALIAHDIVSEKLVISYMGGSIDAVWRSLEKFIIGEREIRNKKCGIENSDYQLYFEHLISRVRKLSPQKIRKKLNLKSIT